VNWRDAVTLAGREIGRRPGRAALTLLAVTLAAALLCALLTIAGTARTRVLSQLSHGGSLAGISVEPDSPNPGQETLDDPVPGPPNALTAAAVARIRSLSDVVSVLPIIVAPVELLPPTSPPAGSTLCPSAGASSKGGSCGGGGAAPGGIADPLTPLLTTSVIGADFTRVNALPITLLAGRFPVSGASGEVVVDEQYLSALGITASRAPEVLGTRVELATSVPANGPANVTRFVGAEVVGVVDQEMTSGDIVAWPHLVGSVYGSESASPGDAPTGAPPIEGAVVIARQLSEVPAVRAAIAGIGYSTAAPVGLIDSVSRYLHVVELVLSGIGLVALLIAALGIANALFAAVRERRREIGVLKAIGARDVDVLRVFLVEAGTIGVLGGILGTVVGIAMAAVITANANAYLHSQGLGGVSLSVPGLLPAASVAGSCLVALVAGFLPARRAARLPAREAVDA
jgi:FtsX-like permease family/MacB-like periplasmic core domain